MVGIVASLSGGSSGRGSRLTVSVCSSARGSTRTLGTLVCASDVALSVNIAIAAAHA